MDWLNLPLRSLVAGYVSLFGDAHPLVSLIPLAILTGVGMLWVFKKTSNQRAIERAKKKMQAYLLELRLYGDDPRLLFGTQGRLLLANLRYVGLMLVPAIYLTIPMVVLLFHLDAVYGIAPLEAGQSAIVTVQSSNPVTSSLAAPALHAPAGFEVETPAVRALGPAQFSWRLRAANIAQGDLEFEWNGRRWTKSIDASGWPSYVSPRRVSSALSSVAHPGESLVDDAGVEWVSIDYPGASIRTGSVELHWLIWFFVVSIVAAYLLKGVFGVTL